MIHCYSENCSELAPCVSWLLLACSLISDLSFISQQVHPPPVLSHKAACLDLSAAAPDDCFHDLFSSHQMSPGTVTAANELQVYLQHGGGAGTAVMGSGRWQG